MNFAKKRHLGFILIATIAILMPIFTINGNHIFLLDFNATQLHLMGMVYTVQELHVMPFLVMLLFVGLFAITSIAGRFWCGWVCPQTILRYVFRDVIQTKLLSLRKNTNNKQKEPDMTLISNNIKYIISILIFIVISVIVAINFMFYFVPYDYFIDNFMDYENHSTMIIFTLLIAFIINLLVVVLKEGFCIYACPYAKVQSILYDKDTFTAVYDTNRGGIIYKDGNKIANKIKDLNENDECITCEKCVKVCPSHIDIRKGLQIECIECLECIDACTVVMGKQNKKSLISWNSDAQAIKNEKTNMFRAKSIAYIVTLSIIITMIVIMSGEKEYMKLNVNRTSQLLIEKENTIINPYIFLFYNSDKKAHTYYFKTNNENIKILRPSKPFVLKAGEERRKIVAMSIDKNKINALKNIKNGVANIIITAYALDDKKIKIKRHIVFFIEK